MIRPVIDSDAARIAEIYNHYIDQTVITFEETRVDAREIAQRMAKVQAAGFPWIVLEHEGQVMGYAYANRWRERVAYRHSVESAVYLDHRQLGQGFGRALYSELIEQLRSLNAIHAVVGGISLPNPASVKLHEALGFEVVGVHREVGRKFGRWIDVMFLQLTLPFEPLD